MREVFDLDKSLGEVEINIAFYNPKDSLQMTLLDPQGIYHPFRQKHCDDVLDKAEAGEEQ
ncbi:MAG TPA: hypothetical protein EYP59_17500 [Thiotrichaceae bacterium]|nr:hypothetical protein [Thiotrichaceae bacterium]